MFELRDICVFRKQKSILQNINLNIKGGEIFGVLGSNGAGKTTLFETIYQNVKYNGNLLLDNLPITKKDISYLEAENYFYPYLSVWDILNLFRTHQNEGRLLKLLGFFNIPKDAVVETLSLGTKKKLAILCNILIDRPVYLFDEPFNGLDFESVEKFYLILEELREKKKIIFISSHVLETLMHCCTKIGHLQEGTFKKIYPPEEYHYIRKNLTAKILQDWNYYND